MRQHSSSNSIFTSQFRPAVFGFGLLLLSAASPAAGAPKLNFTGNSLDVIEITPEKNTGLDRIYVLYDLNNVRISYTAEGSSRPRWMRYSNLGGGYAEEVRGVVYNGSESTLDNPEGDMGYIIEDGDKTYYFWVVNYLPHRLSLKGLDASEYDCDASILSPQGEGGPINFYTISGQQRVLSRDLKISYSTLEWDDAQKLYRQVDATRTVEYLQDQISVRPPALCSTDFTLSGDRFLEHWRWGQSVTSSVVAPSAVEVHTEAIQESASSSDDTSVGSNLIKGEDALLGGSAPATIEFLAYPSDGVIHHEWQMARDENFENVDYRFNEQDLTYTFTEEGTVYLRYIGANADGSCEAYGDTYTVAIGASDLQCPNAFSPNGDGVNDEWKVAYRSLLDFKCWIFDRYGNQIIYFEDPNQGWDGTRGGKPVKSGVYYYVIQATGADGKKYKKSGDINILLQKKDSSSSSSASGE